MTTTETQPPCRWGILATGGIARSFALDLLVDPKTRGPTGQRHTIVAAASSSGQSRAQAFLKDVGASEDARGYGSYEELANDANVDIIYIASPHSHHFQNMMLCLSAGRNVLCEKAFVVNAKQLRVLIETAKEKGLFLMEAVWTRYFPLSHYMKQVILDGKLGIVRSVIGDLTMPIKHTPADSTKFARVEDPVTAGGALLELGVYPINWCFQAIYDILPEEHRQPPTVLAQAKLHRSGVDEQTTVLLSFPRPAEYGGAAHGVATCAIPPHGNRWRDRVEQPAVRILGDDGDLELMYPAFRPTRTRLTTKDGQVVIKEWLHEGPGPGSQWWNWYGEERLPEGEARGMALQADEAAMAMREGKGESRVAGLGESLAVMEVLDEVRRQIGLRYPEEVESAEYPCPA
ncbi:hypothetical protein LTR53_014241 [Teratosphaeriaceae sp. CCFEE 6253]|nr:hypothetical protein LTR53_014241 [Teratosphaeriaceae sp. CCFEE 6253]